MDAQPYSFLARLLHWILALLIVAQISLGFATDWTQRPASHRLLEQHVRLGLLILALTALRFIWRLSVRPPPLPPSVALWQRRAAALTHRILYLLLFLMPVTGYVLWAWTAPVLDWWGVSNIPILFHGGEDEFWRSVIGYAHEYGALLFLGLLALHIGAALHHEFVTRDGLIRNRMGVGARRSSRVPAEKSPKD